MTTATKVGEATLREATREDVNAIMRLGARFLAATPYHKRAPVDLLEKAHTWFDAGVRVILAEAEGEAVGMLAFVTLLHPWTDERTSSEAMWWIEPDHRGNGLSERMTARYEELAREEGATAVELTAWHPGLCRFYERMGYRHGECVHRKELG